MALTPDIAMKYDRLKDRLRPLPYLAVAFSGGVDSTLLLAAAVEVLESRVVALTADSPVHPARETRAAVDISGRLKARHILIRTTEMNQADFRANTRDRCYICKKLIFGQLMTHAATLGIAHLAHGVNRDDLGDYRPGLRAAEELAVIAPLLEARLSKREVRLLARELGLPNWDRPAMACLASRIPYDTPLSRALLTRVEAAEDLLEALGIQGGRVRCHGDVARLELSREADMARVMMPEIRDRLVQGLKAAGFVYVALDLEGYRQGSLNAPFFSVHP
jgi:pyridinium-3,5-biscarboxylic acid mononucleotide sulfurtransferase